MQPQMSSPSAPSLVPDPHSPAAPPKVSSPAHRSQRSRWPSILLALLVIGGLAWWAQRSTQTQANANKAVVVRTAVVAAGVVNTGIRLSGTTGAEKFVSIVTPQLRGNRGGGRRDGSSVSVASIAPPLTIQSNARSSVSGAGSTGATSDGSNVSSTAGAGRSGGSQAFQSSTSRVSQSRPSGSSSASASNASNSSASGGGIGSTANQLTGTGFAGGGGPGGGGGGGGSGDFGLVLQNAVKPGSFVKKGDVVAEFDRQYMLTRLEDYHATVVQQEDAVKKLRAELVIAHKAYDQKLENAKADLDKARLDVKTTPVLSAIEGEKVKLSSEEAEARYQQVVKEKKDVEIGYAAQLRNAELDLETIRLEMKRAEANADRMMIKAPINGLAVMQTMFRGSEFAQIQPGDQLWPGMMFLQIVDPSSMVVNATVNQVDVEKMRIGQKAMVRVDAYPGIELPAHIHSIGAITRQGGSRAAYVKEIPVVLKIDKMDPRVIPDLSVSADVILETETAQTAAPRSAIFYDEATKSHYVYVKNGEIWDRRAVQIGMSNNTLVAIRSGLKPGESVAIEQPAPSQT